MQKQKIEQIENIFGCRFEEPKDEFLEETIRKIESYGAKYDPESDLSAFDQLQICEAIEEATPIPTNNNSSLKGRGEVKGSKGSMVTGVSYDEKNGENEKLTNVVCLNKLNSPKSKENIAYDLAKELDDLDSLPYYENLVRSRRRDFLRNCLVITLNAFKKGQITKSKAAYFTGVVKGKSALQERIKRYKRKKYTT